MSMDEQYAMMMQFERSLSDFNASLRMSLSELESAHANVSPHWQDEMRRQYDALWGTFLETMKHYDRSEGPSYVEFLNIKIHALRRFLYGG